MEYKLIIEIIKYYKELTRDNLISEGDTVSIRLGDSFLITDPKVTGKSEIEAAEIIKVSTDSVLDSESINLHKRIYEERQDVNAIITNHAKYAVIAASVVKKVPAVLDDMAQIVGPQARVSPSSSEEDILKTLNKRGSCLIKNGGAIALGRTLDEAHTASMVLEKNAKAYVEGTILGGAKKINYFECLLMRFIYKKKYSKADQSAKMEELKV